MIIFPAIDILGAEVVRLSQGSYTDVTKYNSNPVAQAQEFADAGAEWVHVVDLDGAKNSEATNHKIIENILSSTNLQVEVGGGIRSLQTIEKYVKAGAKRIVLGTKLATDPQFVASAVSEFGEYIVAGIDARDGFVSISGWTEDIQLHAVDLIMELEQKGIHHLVYTDIKKDGMSAGVDTELYEHVSKVAGFPVVASGGVSGIADVMALANLDAQEHCIEGVIVGRAIYEGTLNLSEALAVAGGAAKSWAVCLQ